MSKNNNYNGYMFDVKDWRAEAKITNMKPDVRDFYRFLIDECYLQGSYKIKISHKLVATQLGLRSDSVATKLQLCSNLDVITIDGDFITVPSVKHRLD